jgi:hypothetical protein
MATTARINFFMIDFIVERKKWRLRRARQPKGAEETGSGFIGFNNKVSESQAANLQVNG